MGLYLSNEIIIFSTLYYMSKRLKSHKFKPISKQEKGILRMNKILKINVKDILYDYRQASEIINKACNRQIPMEVKGGYIKNDNVILSLEQKFDDEKDNYKNYILAPFSSLIEDAITAEITSRYYAGFTTILCFEVEDKTWGLFAERFRS